MAAQLELPISLDDVISTTSVQVVQSINVENLKAFMKWTIARLQNVPPAAGAMGGEAGPQV